MRTFANARGACKYVALGGCARARQCVRTCANVHGVCMMHWTVAHGCCEHVSVWLCGRAVVRGVVPMVVLAVVGADGCAGGGGCR